jgi:hypothetical protein
MGEQLIPSAESCVAEKRDIVREKLVASLLQLKLYCQPKS